MKYILLAVTLAFVQTDAALAQGDIEAGKTKAYTCTGCHGIPGYKNTYPTYKVPMLGGQNAAYLAAALNAYKEENRGHATMQHQAQSLSEADVADISAWLASIELNDASAPAGNEQAEDKTALCQSCHGSDGRGTDPSYPILAGQHADYIERALHDYRSGARKNAIMGGFAGSLSDEDIQAIAAYYAAMPGLNDISGN